MSLPIAPRRQQAEERREQILDAALRIFSEKGFGGASVRDIAREVGITEGLIYHYFESKEQLLQACWKERTWHAQLERILAAAEGRTVGEVLEDVVRESMATLREHGESVRMGCIEMQRDPEMLADHRERISGTLGLLNEFLRGRQVRGELRADCNVDLATDLLMASCYTTFLTWGRLPDAEWSARVERIAKDGVGVILQGISCSEPGSQL